MVSSAVDCWKLQRFNIPLVFQQHISNLSGPNLKLKFEMTIYFYCRTFHVHHWVLAIPDYFGSDFSFSKMCEPTLFGQPCTRERAIPTSFIIITYVNKNKVDPKKTNVSTLLSWIFKSLSAATTTATATTSNLLKMNTHIYSHLMFKNFEITVCIMYFVKNITNIKILSQAYKRLTWGSPGRAKWVLSTQDSSDTLHHCQIYFQMVSNF